MSDIRLRQVAMVGDDYDGVEELLRDVFELEVAYRDPGDRPGHDAGVSIFGLRNFVMPIGDQFLELVSPKPGVTNSAGGRFIERRNGPGGYMLLLQVPRARYAEMRDRVLGRGVRLAAGDDIGDGTSEAIHLHPKDLPGAIAELRWCENEDHPDGDWWPVEKTWRDAKRTTVIDAIVGAEIQTADPAALATRWSDVLGVAVIEDAMGNPGVALANATIRFVVPSDGRPEGLGGLDVRAIDRDRAMAAAKAAGCALGDATISICGLRFHLT